MTGDLTAELDATHLDSLAAVAVIRTQFRDAHIRVGREAAEFQTVIDRICRQLPNPGLDGAQHLAHRERA